MKRRRDRDKSRKEILNVAFREVYARGFQGVSVDDIVAKTKLTKGAFYHQFPTKLDLGYALVEEVITPMILSRWLDPLSGHADPVAGVLERLRDLIGHAPKIELRRGCPLNNLVQEMAPVDPGFRRRLNRALELWITGLEVHLRRARLQGQLRRDVDTHALARFLVMAHEGFYGMLKANPEAKIFAALHDNLDSYLRGLRAG